MANDLNQCQFIGRLGRDPEARYASSGDAITSFSIAVGWKSKDKEGAEWVNCTALGKLGEICGQYLKKGSQVFVQGRFKTDKYTDKNGVERYSTKINLDNMQMLGGRAEGESKPQETRNAQGATRNNDLDSDIPFAPRKDY